MFQIFFHINRIPRIRETKRRKEPAIPTRTPTTRVENFRDAGTLGVALESLAGGSKLSTFHATSTYPRNWHIFFGSLCLSTGSPPRSFHFSFSDEIPGRNHGI